MNAREHYTAEDWARDGALVAIIALLVAILLCYASCAPAPAAGVSPPIAPKLQAAAQDLAAQNDVLKKQVASLQAAVDAAGKTGDAIDEAKAQGAQARAAAIDRPAATQQLDAQTGTLNEASRDNQDTLGQLAAARNQNDTLIQQNAQLQAKLQSLEVDGAAKDAQVQSLASAGAKKDQAIDGLQKKLADKDLSELHFYFGVSLAVLIAGIAGAIWIPSPAKYAAYVAATAGAVGIGVTVFLIAWMAWLKWIVLAALVGLAGYVAWKLWQTHGALTKTAQGVEGIKQDLAEIVGDNPGTTLAEGAKKVLTDWFGDIKNAGIFHWLHSEYEALIARVRRAIGSVPAAIPQQPSAAVGHHPV